MTTRVEGRIRPPGDKSLTQRALLFGALAGGTSRIRRPLVSGDTLSMIASLRALGTEIVVAGDEVTVTGRGRTGLTQASDPVDCGNSGTTARLLTGVLAAHPFVTRLVGDSSLSTRPMRRVTEPLTAMGASFVEEHGDGLPLVINGGPLRSLQPYRLPVASAQIKTALILAGYCARVEVSLTEPAPSRDHTERMFRALGQRIDSFDGELRFQPSGEMPGFAITVPGDLSSAAFLVAAALLADSGELVVERVGVNETRSGAVRVMQRMGAAVAVEPSGEELGEPVGDLRVAPSKLHGTVVTPDEVPALTDELPILAVLACRARGTTLFEGVGELRFKESDRLGLLARNLRSIGVTAIATEDRLEVEGTTGTLAGRIETGGDHRINMAFAVLARMPGVDIDLSETGSSGISYPGFEADLRRVLQHD